MGAWLCVLLLFALLLPAAAAPDPAPPAFVSKIAAFEPKTIQCRVGITVYVNGGVRMEMRLWARPPTLWRMDVTGVTPDAPPQNDVVGMRMLLTIRPSGRWASWPSRTTAAWPVAWRCR